MKVILTDEVYGLGGRGEVVNVKDGYARNYLLPKQLAKEATTGNIAVVEQQKRKWAMLSQEEKKAAEELAGKLGKVEVTIEKKVGDSGTLYGSVTSNEIVSALEAQGFEVEKRQLELGEPIKTLGSHEVSIHLHREVSASITVTVIGEGGERAPEPVEAAPEPVEEEAEAEAEAAAPAAAEEPAETETEA